MAARSTNALYKHRAEDSDSVGEGPVIASDIVYQGGLLFFAAAGALTPVPATGTRFAGIAKFQADNSAGALGDKRVQYWRKGEFLFTGITATMTLADEGSTIYAASDNVADLTLTASTNNPIGIITEYISASSVWVSLADGRALAA